MYAVRSPPVPSVEANRWNPRTVLALCIVLDALAFALDLWLPVEYAIATLYIGATLLSFALASKATIVGVAALGSVLVVVGYLLSPASPAYGTVETMTNRGLAMLVLWWTAALAVGHQAARAALVESQATLRTNEARLRSILDTAPEALITIDQRGRIESFSRSAQSLFGYEEPEVLGKNVSLLMPSPYREEHDGYIERYLRTDEKKIIGIGRVVTARRKDGTSFPIELSVGEAVINNHRLFTGFIRDLTATQKIEQELRQAQKMEAVGQLTGGVAHDFNNLLTVILGNLEMLEARIRDERQSELIKEARETAEHGARLTGQLLAFGRRQPLEPELTNVGALLEEMTPLLRRTLGEMIDVRSRTSQEVARVNVDRSQLQNAILNLAINARDAMPRGGSLTVAAENADIDSDYARVHAEVRPGRYVVLSVTDTGTGMRPDVRERAFEPFFTTKEVGAGSGLGLSMVYGFAKQSKGHVQLYSEVGHGTTVRIYLPRADDPDGAQSAPPRADLIRGSGETILVVEDDQRVRRLTVTRLRDLGYHVLEAANGPEALSLLPNHPEIALVFTDVVMPGGMTGTDLAREIQSKRPELKVLFTSGYAEPDLLQKGIARSGTWLRKPYTTADLARTIRAVLE